MDLTKILKPGMKIYSLVDGEVEITKITEDIKYPIHTSGERGSCNEYTKEGHFRYMIGECVLFPSKDYHHWDEIGIEICAQPNRVEKGQDYFFITDLFRVAFKKDRYDETDGNRYRSGNPLRISSLGNLSK